MYRTSSIHSVGRSRSSRLGSLGGVTLSYTSRCPEQPLEVTGTSRAAKTGGQQCNRYQNDYSGHSGHLRNPLRQYSWFSLAGGRSRTLSWVSQPWGGRIQKILVSATCAPPLKSRASMMQRTPERRWVLEANPSEKPAPNQLLAAAFRSPALSRDGLARIWQRHWNRECHRLLANPWFTFPRTHASRA